MKWYFIDKEYVRYLRKFDKNVPNTDYGNNKMKGFIGIVLITEDNLNYFAPVTSYKTKFLNMPDNIDFIKILDTNGKILSAIDLNNMIPVPKNKCIQITFDNIEDFRIFNSEKEKIQYWNLLNKEIKFINSREGYIKKERSKIIWINYE